MAKSPAIEQRLRAMTDADAVVFLDRLPDETLRVIDLRWGECECDLPLLPCPLHGAGPDCDCIVTPDRLPECAAHADSPLSVVVRRWLKYRLYPELFSDLPTPPVPSKALLREVQATVFAERASAGYGLRHPGDYLRRYRRGEAEMVEVLGAERIVTTRHTNPEAPANGAALPKLIHRRTHARAQ